MNPVLILTRNNLELTKKCVESVRRQDLPTFTAIFDNGSTDGTLEWCRRQQNGSPYSTPHSSNTNDFAFWPEGGNAGVSYGWNKALKLFFENPSCNYVLVLNNDAIIPPWFYRTLLEYNKPFITGVAIDQMPTEPAPPCPLTPNPDFSAFLIRRSAWDTIGTFDEAMKIYCSDCDYHIRAHQLGVPLWKANVPYYHVNSQTLKRAEPGERALIEAQANIDREAFKGKWGCLPGTKEYEQLFI